MMQFQVLPLAEAHFPQTEWQWLREPSNLATSPKAHPDLFFWAAKVNGKVWAWSQQGTALQHAPSNAAFLILPTDGSELQAYGLYLKTSFQYTQPQDIEWVNAIDVASNRLKFDLSQGTLPPHWDQALRASGFEPHAGILAQRAKWLFLSNQERKFLFSKKWDPSTFELLESLSANLREAFIKALKKFNLSAGQAKEACNFVILFTKKIGADAALKFLEKDFAGAEEFRSSLGRIAQPEFAAMSQERIEKLRALKVPPRTTVFGDPTFENDTIKITHTPRQYSDFELFKVWVNEEGLEEKMRDLLEIYKC